MAFSFNKAATPAPGAAGGFSFGASTAQPAPAANPFGSFGQQQQQQQPQQQGASLFGAPKTTTPTATGSGFSFGGASTAGAAQQAPAANSFGSFGQQQQQQPQPAAGGGLFGNTQQQQPAAGGGLFGSTQQQPSGGGLFGNTQNQNQPAASTGLFGAQQQQPQAVGGLFGSTKPAGGLFGSQQQQQPQQQPQQGGLFGAKPGGLFGNNQQTAAHQQQPFGQQPQSQPQTQQSLFGKPQQSLLQSNAAPKSTKFSDLPEETQKGIEQMDSWIKDQKQIGASIRTEDIGQAIWQTSGDVKAASDEQTAISQGLSSLKASLEHLASKVQSEAEDLQKLLETWEAAKPVDARHTLRPIAHRDFPQEFFARVAVDLEERVNRYKRTIALLARAVTSLANDHERLSPQIVVQTIKNNERSIISLAGQLEELQLRMNAARAEFIDEYRDSTNSMRDPFQIAREEKGLSLLRA